MFKSAMAIENSQEDREHLELSRLQNEVQRLERENRDLRISLVNTAEHGDCIEAELSETNAKLRKEVSVRRRVELTLQSLVALMSRQRDDLEIILQTLIEHGDVLDLQWEQKISQANLLAISDGLTQIANRRRFDEYLEEQWQRMARSQSFLSILLCDIDFFKQYNDTYGHTAGDSCLQQAAEALSGAVYRSSDLLARYGGEEFAAVLPQTDTEQAFKVARRMQAAIDFIKIPHAGSSISSSLTVSIGIASVIPSEQQAAKVLLDEADKQLYRAKNQGRNQIVRSILELP
jgi:diguanylate cyclase (GGDEF)-like protein